MKLKPRKIFHSDIGERLLIGCLLLTSLLVVAVLAIRKERSRTQENPMQVKEDIAESDDGQFLIGSRFLEEKDYGPAVASFSAALKENPRDVRSLVARGVAYFEQGQLADAEVDFRSASRIQPSCYQPHVNLGIVQRRKGNLQAAIASFTAAMMLKPEELSIIWHRAACFAELDEFHAVIDDLSSVLRLDTMNIPARMNRAAGLINTGRFEAAVADLSRVEISETDLLASSKRLMLAYCHLQLKDVAECLRLCQTEIENESQRDVARFIAANASAELRLGSSEHDAHLLLLDELEIDTEQLQEMTESVAEVLSFHEFPEFPTALLLVEDMEPPLNQLVQRERAQQLLQQGREFLAAQEVDIAAACFTEALRADPENADALFNRAVTRIDQRRGQEAVIDLELLSKSLPNNARVLTVLAMLYAQQNFFEKAVSSLDQTIRIDSQNPVNYVNRALVRFKQENFQAVIDDCNRAMELGYSDDALTELKAKAQESLARDEQARWFGKEPFKATPG